MKNKIITILIWMMMGIILPFCVLGSLIFLPLIIIWITVGLFVTGIDNQGNYL